VRAYIFDIDGTLADCSHRLHHIQSTPKDWDGFFSECHADAPIHHIIELARHLKLSGMEIIYVSGRSDQCREQTELWLNANKLQFGPVYMRTEGDHRDDDTIKVELLAQLRADGFDPIMAFDDRDRVVTAWRRAGVPCAQVAEGNF
jgi:phosphoglycolate phosphatase-like HAD superfamily hydrolase